MVEHRCKGCGRRLNGASTTSSYCHMCRDARKYVPLMPTLIERHKFSNFHAVLTVTREYEGGDPDGCLSEM